MIRARRWTALMALIDRVVKRDHINEACIARNLVDLSSRNANPSGVFDGEAVPLSDVADTEIEEFLG